MGEGVSNSTPSGLTFSSEQRAPARKQMFYKMPNKFVNLCNCFARPRNAELMTTLVLENDHAHCCQRLAAPPSTDHGFLKFYSLPQISPAAASKGWQYDVKTQFENADYISTACTC